MVKISDLSDVMATSSWAVRVVAFSFGDGAMPKNLVAELDWPARKVYFRIAESNGGEELPPLCEIPLSQLLMLRESLGAEALRHLREDSGELDG